MKRLTIPLLSVLFTILSFYNCILYILAFFIFYMATLVGNPLVMLKAVIFNVRGVFKLVFVAV